MGGLTLGRVENGLQGYGYKNFRIKHIIGYNKQLISL